MSKWIKWGGCSAFESKEYGAKIMKSLIPTLRSGKVCACVIEVLDDCDGNRRYAETPSKKK